MSALRKTVCDAEASASPACPSRGRPIDLVHLARQTLGDRSLEGEVLGMMARQIELAEARMPAAEAKERLALAHAIKGAARNVGAFGLAEAAEAVENHPLDGGARSSLALELARTAQFIRTLQA